MVSENKIIGSSENAPLRDFKQPVIYSQTQRRVILQSPYDPFYEIQTFW